MNRLLYVPERSHEAAAALWKNFYSFRSGLLQPVDKPQLLSQAESSVGWSVLDVPWDLEPHTGLQLHLGLLNLWGRLRFPQEQLAARGGAPRACPLLLIPSPLLLCSISSLEAPQRGLC